MIVIPMVAIAVLVLAVIIALALRRATFAEGRTEARLHRADAHALAYAVPNGQDAAVLVAALAHEGITATADMEGGVELLLIDCPAGERGRVRDILEHVHKTAIEGAEMHVAHVSFQDER